MQQFLRFAFVFLLFGISLMANAQQSQEEWALKHSLNQATWYWYDNHTMGASKDPSYYDYEHMATILFSKGSDGRITKISITTKRELSPTDYFPDSDNQRYYRSKTAAPKCIYANEQGLWIMGIDESEATVGLYGLMSTIPLEEMAKLPVNYPLLAEVKTHLATPKVISSVQGQDIMLVMLDLLFDGQAASGKTFKLGITTSFMDGSDLKSKSLGGSQKESDYKIVIEGAIDAGTDSQSGVRLWRLPYKSQTNTPGKIVIKVLLAADNSQVISEEQEVPCQEGGPVAAGKVSVFSEDNRGYLYGFRDETGQTIIKPAYAKVETLNNGFFRTLSNGRYGFVNAQGIEISGLQYEESYTEFTDGLLGVQLKGKQGFIDESGKVVIPIVHKSVRPFDKGIALVCKDSLWGAYNTKGETVIPFLYKKIEAFNTLGLARVNKSGKYGFVNKAGKEVIPAIYESTDETFSEGFIGAKLDKKQGFLDATGKVIIPFTNTYIKPFSSGIAFAKKDTLWGAYNTKGEIVIAFQYQNIEEFNGNGLALAQKGGKFGYVNKQGKEIIPVIYESGGVVFEKGVTGVKKEGKWALMNEKGSFVSDYIYYKLGNFNKEGITCAANAEGKFGLINTKGETVLAFSYNWIEYPLYNAPIRFKNPNGSKDDKTDKYGLFSATGKLIQKPYYDEMEPFSNGYAVIKKGSAYGYINTEGTNVSHIEYGKAGSMSESLTAEVMVREQVKKLEQVKTGWFAVKSNSYDYLNTDASDIFIINDTPDDYFIHYRDRSISLDDPALIVSCPSGEMVQVTFRGGYKVFYSTNGSNYSAKTLFEMGDPNTGKGHVVKLFDFINE